VIAPTHDKDGFFKYYTVESAKATLRSGARKWSTPLLFNDPFDNQFDLRFEEPSLDAAKTNLSEFHEVLSAKEPFKEGQFGALTPKMELLRQVYAANPGLEYSAEEQAELEVGALEDMHRVAATMPEANAEIRKILNDTTVFCLSETHDNLLMWSHYAQNHTGAVIKFLALPEVDSPLIVAQPVRYSEKMPVLAFASLLQEEQAVRLAVLETITLSKSEVWSYEREWRIVASLRDKAQSFEILPYAPEEVGAVYLGCKMTPEDRSEIIDITHSRYAKAAIFQAEKHDSEFALRFEEIP
jgi:hypothetical protein